MCADKKKPYKKLVIIGNGFDCWLGLPTSFENFRRFYLEHIDETLKKLNLQRYSICDTSGNQYVLTPVDLVYGDPFQPERIEDEFFWNFEESLNKIDDQLLNLFFGRSDNGVLSLQKAVTDAEAVLRSIFTEWVLSIDMLEEKRTGLFPGDCFFINFNYTDTLETVFGIEQGDIFHIHGSVRDPESLVFGHSSHPDLAFRELNDQQLVKPLFTDSLPRLKELYAVENILYQTDKHVEDNIDRLCVALCQRGAHIEDFEDVYVLGHSFGNVDFEYFQFIDRVTRCGCNYDRLSPVWELNQSSFPELMQGNLDDKKEAMLMDWIYLNLQYASHQRETRLPDSKDLFEPLTEAEKRLGINQYQEEKANEALRQRFLFEQAIRTKDAMNDLAEAYGIKEIPPDCCSILSLIDHIDGGHTKRKKNANWHVSYRTPSGGKRIQRCMKKMGLESYTLIPSVDEIIKEMS